jgi:hypothetical protein
MKVSRHKKELIASRHGEQMSLLKNRAQNVAQIFFSKLIHNIAHGGKYLKSFSVF